MRIYIICDMEGGSGVADWRQVTFSDPASLQGRRLATLDLNAVVEGAIAGGATEIVAWDGHGNCPGALDAELLHPACRLIANGAQGGPVGLTSDYDAVMMCGLHAMAGAAGGVLAHSFTRDIMGYWVNGVEMGEIGMNLLAASQHGLPTVFLSGDLAATREVRLLVPGIETVSVKEGLSPYGVLLTAPEAARAALQAGAERAMSLVGRLDTYVLDKPYRMVTRWREQHQAAKHAESSQGRLIDPYTVEVEASTV